MEKNKERLPFMVPYLIGYVVGSIIMAITSSNNDEAADKIRLAQINARQIQEQLAPVYQDTSNLLVDGEEFTFSYDDNGKATSCEGVYDVKEEVATVVGDVVCSVETSIDQSTTTTTQLR